MLHCSNSLRLAHCAGAVVLGKTNMHELAFGISGFNPNYNTGPQPGVRNAAISEVWSVLFIGAAWATWVMKFSC